jgi:hypothetical protein
MFWEKIMVTYLEVANRTIIPHGGHSHGGLHIRMIVIRIRIRMISTHMMSICMTSKHAHEHSYDK